MNTTPILVCLFAIVGPAALASGASATATAPAKVGLIRPITLRRAQDLWFGCLVINPNSGQLQIIQTAAEGGGTRKPDPPGVTQLQTSSQPWHNARFEVGGHTEAGFTVTMPGHPVVIRGPGLQTMLVRLNYYCSDTVIDPLGTSLWVGGKLDIPENPQPGHYSGDFEVTIAYQ